MSKSHELVQSRKCRCADVWLSVKTALNSRLEIWDGVSDARITFTASELGIGSEDGMARLTENLNLQRGLLRHLEHFPDIQLLQRTKVKSIIRDEDERGNWPLVFLDNDKILRTRLLVNNKT